MGVILDAAGRPIKREVLTTELAAPSLTGVRTVWDNTVASGLTPYRLASLLQNAATGDHYEYLTLAEEMEERDLHYACELGKRKLAVSRLPVTVESASDSAHDKKLADAVRGLIKRPGFRSLKKDLLDGLGKGYSVAEIIWDRSGREWLPARYEWRDPRFFQFDDVSRRELRLRDEADMMNGLPLPPYKFIVHLPHLKTGIPIRGGLARLAAWSWMFKNYTIKDWMAFAEAFGMPLRVGKYPAGAKPEEIEVLKMAVANLGTDAAAVMPQSMVVEFVEAAKQNGGESLFQRMADFFDAQVSKGILGQTATTQGTPGKLGNEEAQNEVRHDIRDDDGDQLAETLNGYLVRPFIDLNFGPQQEYPELIVRAIKKEDITTLSTALKELVPLGLEVEQSVVRDKLGLPDPAPGAVLLRQQPAPPEAGKAQAENRQGCTCGHCATALNRDTGESADDIDDLVAEELADWQPMMQPVLDPLRKAVDGAESLEELLAALPDIFSGQDVTALVDALAAAGFKAAAMGDGGNE